MHFKDWLIFLAELKKTRVSKNSSLNAVRDILKPMVYVLSSTTPRSGIEQPDQVLIVAFCTLFVQSSEKLDITLQANTLYCEFVVQLEPDEDKATKH